MGGDTLQVPADLVGTVEEVRRRLRPRVTAFRRGGPWDPAPGELVDVADVEGLIVLNGPAPLLSGEQHIQAFLPLSLLVDDVVHDRVTQERIDEAVGASLATAWGVIGVLAPANQLLVLNPGRVRPIADAAVRSWPEIVSVGARYTVGSRGGSPFWDLTTNLQQVLARMGVSDAALSAPLPQAGLSALVRGDEPGR